jgi:hypothetical protein
MEMVKCKLLKVAQPLKRSEAFLRHRFHKFDGRNIMSNFFRCNSVKGKGLVSVSVEQQLSTLRRWLTALTVVTVILAIAVFVLSSSRFEHIRAHRIEVAPPNKPALIVLSTNPLGDPIVLINDQKGRKRFGITLDENGNAMVEWFASDGRTLKRLSIP